MKIRSNSSKSEQTYFILKPRIRIGQLMIIWRYMIFGIAGSDKFPTATSNKRSNTQSDCRTSLWKHASETKNFHSACWKRVHSKIILDRWSRPGNPWAWYTWIRIHHPLRRLNDVTILSYLLTATMDWDGNSGENTSKELNDFFTSHGVKNYFSTSYEKWQNGLSESSVGSWRCWERQKWQNLDLEDDSGSVPLQCDL